MPAAVTLGNLLLNEALPEDMRDSTRVWDKKAMLAVLREVAERYPDRYRDVSKRLADIGRRAATESGGNSFGLAHMRKSKAAQRIADEIQAKLAKILDDDRLTDKQRHEMIIRAVGDHSKRQMAEVYKESLEEGNPLALQIQSGSRGNEMNLSSLRGSDMLYADHRDETIPLPVLRSYSQGLTPAEYWAGTYGARKGVIDVKMATQRAGFLAKQLSQVSHRLMVADLDGDGVPDTVRGLPADTDDTDNEGALLAADAGPYKRNTRLTPKILASLKSKGIDRILVRSPIVGGSPEGGVYARDVGVRERGVMPGKGEMVGLTAAQALAEPLSQGMLSSKHTGGVAGQGKTTGGFASINQMIQASGSFHGSAAHAETDGRVEDITEAPSGGHYVTVAGTRHYVAEGFPLKVKRGDEVEAGDVLSEGLPDPSKVVEHKGVGEGRRYFVHAAKDAFKAAGVRVHRRNLELLARGLINHVRLTEETDRHVPDDVVPYSSLEHSWTPREDAVSGPVGKGMLGRYLEKPVLHYSIGTKVRPSVLREMERFGVKDAVTHHEPLPFQPEMVRGMSSLQHDPDFMTRMYGSGLKSSLLDAVHRGGTSDESGTSFVPGLSRAVDFGRIGMVRQPEKGWRPDEVEEVQDVPEAKTTQPVLPGLGSGSQGPASGGLQGVQPVRKRWSLFGKFGSDSREKPSVEGRESRSVQKAAESLLRGKQDRHPAETQGAQVREHREIPGDREKLAHLGSVGRRSLIAPREDEERAGGGGVHTGRDLRAGSWSLLPLSKEGDVREDAPGTRGAVKQAGRALAGEHQGVVRGVQPAQGRKDGVKAKSWAGLFKWSADRRARREKKAQAAAPGIPPVPKPIKPPEIPKPPKPEPPENPYDASKDYVAGTASDDLKTPHGPQQPRDAFGMMPDHHERAWHAMGVLQGRPWHSPLHPEQQHAPPQGFSATGGYVPPTPGQAGGRGRGTAHYFPPQPGQPGQPAQPAQGGEWIRNGMGAAQLGVMGGYATQAASGLASWVPQAASYGRGGWQATNALWGVQSAQQALQAAQASGNAAAIAKATQSLAAAQQAQQALGATAQGAKNLAAASPWMQRAGQIANFSRTVGKYLGPVDIVLGGLDGIARSTGAYDADDPAWEKTKAKMPAQASRNGPVSFDPEATGMERYMKQQQLDFYNDLDVRPHAWKGIVDNPIVKNVFKLRNPMGLMAATAANVTDIGDSVGQTYSMLTAPSPISAETRRAGEAAQADINDFLLKKREEQEAAGTLTPIQRDDMNRLRRNKWKREAQSSFWSGYGWAPWSY